MLIGLDAVPPGILDECCQSGLLPNISAMRSEGRYGVSESDADLFGASVWPTFFTMSDVSHHGVHHLVQWDRVRKRLRPPGDGWCEVTPFWKAMAAAGIPTIALDVPFSATGTRVAGATEVVGWGMHEGIWSWSNPRGLLKALRKRHGVAAQRREGPGERSEDEIASELPGILADVARRTRIIEDLAARFPWRVLVAPFSETHRAGHWFWSDRITGVPQGGLRQALRAVDDEIPRLRRLLRPQDHMVLFSVHGMDASYDMDRLGEAAVRYLNIPRPVSRSRFPDPVRLLRRSVPVPIARFIARRLPQSLYNWTYYRLRNSTGNWRDLDWVVSPLDGMTYLYANRPDESDGAVSPEEIAWVRSRLQGIKTLDGATILKALTRPADRYTGPRLDLLPDLVASAPRHDMGARLVLADGRVVQVPRNASRDGEHTGRGFYIQVGPGVEAGSSGAPTAGQDLARLFLSTAGIRLAETPAP